MSVRAYLVTTVLAATAALSATAFGQAGEPLTVTPTQGGQFTEVTVSGSNCRGGTPSAVAGALTGPPGTGTRIEGTPFETAVVGTVFSPTPDAAGNWSATFAVPPFLAAGQYQVRAICKSSPDAATGAEYQPRPFTVLAAAATPTIAVTPREARAGQPVRLTVSGTLCPGPDAAVDVRVFERVPEAVAGDEFVADATFRPDAQGAWAGAVTIPATARAGTYGVGAACRRGQATLFLYSPVPEVVLTAAAAPPQIALTG